MWSIQVGVRNVWEIKGKLILGFLREISNFMVIPSKIYSITYVGNLSIYLLNKIWIKYLMRATNPYKHVSSYALQGLWNSHVRRKPEYFLLSGGELLHHVWKLSCCRVIKVVHVGTVYHHWNPKYHSILKRVINIWSISWILKSEIKTFKY